MATLILNSNEEEDIKLLLDTAKKLGLDLRLADNEWLLMEEAERLSKIDNPQAFPTEEIVDLCRSVRKSRYEKANKRSS
ncbi:MAG: hypothetical protein JJU34_02710 [Lunatimonas sp.]|uniref:hypothetical protein n=1 Tax=Lunatimonas sp. TaxID=2060141 RepID=UPI00263AFADD|nr:hypothetical protein [Lunatimonas sp.]MCC5936171.1 hypothetical protein [Lunatimonas sp.]